MSGTIVNRRQSSEQADQSPAGSAAAGAAPSRAAREKRATTKSAAAPRKRMARAKKAPPRMRARWGVFDATMKQVAVYDYNQRTAADDKVADLHAKGKGTHFLQIVKEPMPEAAPAEVTATEPNV
jgi:hypothetical protein